MSSRWQALLAGFLALLLSPATHADTLRVAVAASMKPAFNEMLVDFKAAHPGDTVEASYGSSGKFVAQLANGAPFDLFFSADMSYPQELVERGLAAGRVQPYAIGRLVLWSLQPKLGQLPLEKLPVEKINRFAIANPALAPYGLRAREALEHAGLLAAMEPKLVLGESIAQTAQFVDTGAADAGLVALSLVMSPELAGKGRWTRVPDDWHQPLVQGFVVLKTAAGKPLAMAFAGYVTGSAAQRILERYGFDLP